MTVMINDAAITSAFRVYLTLLGSDMELVQSLDTILEQGWGSNDPSLYFIFKEEIKEWIDTLPHSIWEPLDEDTCSYILEEDAEIMFLLRWA